MVVGNNESTTTKNAGEIAMAMQLCDAGRITR
jgi:hypothetical protein